MAKGLDTRLLQLTIEKVIDRRCRQIATQEAQERLSKGKGELLNDFLNDEISQEIQAGPESGGGILSSEGNLFSFLGFRAGETPVDDLYDYLAKHIYLSKTIIYDRGRKAYLINVYGPSRDAIKSVTKLPWGTAASWVYAIENGLPSLNQFLAARERPLGRSTGGLQIKGIVTKGIRFNKRNYLTSMLDNFIENLKG